MPRPETVAEVRFAFGENWSKFLTLVNEERIAAAELSLRSMLGVSDLKGQRFLDIGSGSGLFSLAARRLGALVLSFDLDPEAVSCTRELKQRFLPHDEEWHIEQGSILDTEFVKRLGQFDVVYSWGVLHHTGSMWIAFENAIRCVSNEKGKLFIAIYNDQGWKSHSWWLIKWLYNKLPRLLKAPFAAAVMGCTHLLVVVKYTLRLKPGAAIASLRSQKKVRGMSAKHDSIDWAGGFPYEFAKIETLIEYFQSRGFSLVKSCCTTSLGCNELFLERTVCVE